MSDEKLMTVEEFDTALKKWAAQISSLSRNTLFQTHGSGELFRNLHDYVDPIKNNTGRRIAFKFPRHGVFRHYGAGRGYIIVNGQPVRGYRVLSVRELKEKTLNPIAQEMLSKGYSMSYVRKAKIVTQSDKPIPRKPLNWLDQHITRNSKTLTDISVRFYGDQSLEALLKQIDRIKIVKKKL